MATAVVELVVKSPNDKVPSQHISCPRSWTVKELKAHLCKCYPSKPLPTSQRLIHAGKLLKDETVLGSIFGESEGPQTMHLVCRSSKTASKPGDTFTESNSEVSNADSARDLTPAELVDYQRGYYEYLQQFYMNSGDQYASTNGYFAYPYANLQTQSPWISSPHIGFQNQWQPSLGTAPPVAEVDAEVRPQNRAVAEGNQWFRGARAFLADLGVFNAEELDADPQNGNHRDGQQQQQQAMMVGNPLAGGFMAAEDMGENGGNMDIVDRFYMLFRLCLFIGLCFAYSSLDKAIIVFSVAAYVYFYNIYRRHAAVRQAAAQAQQANPPPAQEPPATDPPLAQPTTNSVGDIDQELRQRVTTDHQPATAEPQPLPVNQEPRFARLANTVRLVASTSYQFVSSLIASLIPEQPPPIRLD